MRAFAFVVAWTMALASCQPVTTRPTFVPFPEAASTEIRLDAAAAVQRLADALRADSIPVAELERQDWYLDSGWFASATGTPVHHRPIGPSVVRIRGWVNPGQPYASVVTVETVYRPLADPSRTERDLERPVPADHPVAVKVRAILDSMVARYGGTAETKPSTTPMTTPSTKPTTTPSATLPPTPPTKP